MKQRNKLVFYWLCLLAWFYCLVKARIYGVSTWNILIFVDRISAGWKFLSLLHINISLIYPWMEILWPHTSDSPTSLVFQINQFIDLSTYPFFLTQLLCYSTSSVHGYVSVSPCKICLLKYGCLYLKTIPIQPFIETHTKSGHFYKYNSPYISSTFTFL